MYAYTDEDAVENYHRSVRDRANVSLHELEDILQGTSHHTTLQSQAKHQLESVLHPRTLKWYEENNRPTKYKDAASQLNQILGHEPQRLPPSGNPGQRAGLPSSEELAVIVQTQTDYMYQLESENRYCKDELFAMRARLSELIEENKRLHEELKSSVLQEIMGDDKEIHKLDDLFMEETGGRIFQKRELKNIQVEMERLNSLHAAKCNRLEAQLEHSRSEIQKYEQMIEDYKSQLRVHDSIPTRDNGFLPYADGHNSFHVHTINSLTRERDELMDQVTSLKTRVHEMNHREDEAYGQMKKGIELVEQAQLEQTQALVQKEQLAEELNNMKERFDRSILDTQARLHEERESVRRENKLLVDELNAKLRETLEKNAAWSAELEKLSRDKVALIGELDETKLQLKRFDKESSIAHDTFRQESTHASIQKSHAVLELSKTKKAFEEHAVETKQEKSRMSMEIEDLRRRLKKAERDLVNSKEECIHLTSNTQALERELHLAKLARDSIERGRNEDMKAVSIRAKQREEQLGSFIEDVEEKNARTTHDMDVMLKKQNRLIGKLREECKRQTAQVEKLVKKNRSECGNLRTQNDELRHRLERAVTHMTTLEEQSEQHDRVHKKMTERLKMLDDHGQNQSQQILELIACQSRLMKDRQLLVREVEFLRKEIAKSNEEDLNKFLSSNKPLVDEIISTVNSEEKEAYFSGPKERVHFDESTKT
ncbi:serologically defined colon cancer antigen 8 homolog [Mytilus galloprovincialis]|uniref:serologically defined colon cancer antigen 8 homolog n=1 Tax=Mytilus galloprovincialis TaxID=29158 RepID=UPI003F7B47C5